MVELIPCIGEVVKTPYYVLGLGMNVYSIEELCFYLCENAYILDRDIMDAKLCQWLEREVGLRKLGADLFEQLQKENDLSEFVTTILRETHYCSDEELEEIEKILIDNASLGFAQKRKARGDSLLRSNKYSLAIEEYQYILQGMQPNEDAELYANILHNTGTAYAKLFLFAKAGQYFKMAYDINQNTESYAQYLATLRIAKGQEEYVNAIVLKGLDKDAAYKLEDRITEILSGEIDTPYMRAYRQACLHKQNGRISEFYDTIDTALSEWKRDYRKGMMNT